MFIEKDCLGVIAICLLNEILVIDIISSYALNLKFINRHMHLLAVKFHKIVSWLKLDELGDHIMCMVDINYPRSGI